jgi:hypothetical protein
MLEMRRTVNPREREHAITEQNDSLQTTIYRMHTLCPLPKVVPSVFRISIREECTHRSHLTGHMFNKSHPTGDIIMVAGGKPPRDVYSPYEVVKVVTGKPIRFVCQNREWEDIYTHWYGNHSVKCGGEDKCQLCLDRRDRIWKGYLLGTPFASDTTCIFQITPLGAYMLEEQTHCERGLLGSIICLTRKGVRANSPLEAVIRGRVPDVHEIGAEKLERTVAVLYRQYARLKRSDDDSN